MLDRLPGFIGNALSGIGDFLGFGGGVGSDLDSLMEDQSLYAFPKAASDSFKWTDLVVPGLAAATSLATGIPAAQAAKRQDELAREQLLYDRERAEAMQALELGKMLLDAQFGRGGGGGGGRAVPVTTGVDVANVITQNMAPRQAALNALISSATGPLGGRGV